MNLPVLPSPNTIRPEMAKEQCILLSCVSESTSCRNQFPQLRLRSSPLEEVTPEPPKSAPRLLTNVKLSKHEVPVHPNR